MHNIGLAWKNVSSRRKQTIRMISLLVLAMCLLIATTLVERGVEEFINYIMKEAPDTRMIREQGIIPEYAEEMYEYYRQDDRVEDIVLCKQTTIFSGLIDSQELSGEEMQSALWLHPYHKGIEDYSEYSEKLKEGEVLIPQYFNPDTSQGLDNVLTDKLRLVDASDWIGKEIKGETSYKWIDGTGNINDTEERMEFSLKIVGTYDNVQMCEYLNKVYVSPETMNRIYDASFKEPYASMSNPFKDSMSLTILAKNTDYLEQIAKEISCDPECSGRDESALYVFFVNSLKIGAIVLFVAALINIVITLVEEIRERRSEIALLRAMGYTDDKIGGMFLMELIMIICLTMLVCLVFCFGFVQFANWFISCFLGTAYYQVRVVFDFLYVIKVIGVCTVFMLITFSVVYYRMEQVNTIEALKEE